MPLVVFTGGARSGKSAAAQTLARTRALDAHGVTVVVFGKERIDAEFADRVARHRAARPADWSTVEASSTTSWFEDIATDSLVLVDCLGTALGLAMEGAYDAIADRDLGGADAASLPAGFEREVSRRFDPMIEWVLQRGGDTIVVTNEVGDGVIPAFATGRLFRDLLGSANRRVIGSADSSYLCTAGRLLDLSGLPTHVDWPSD